MVEDPTKGSNVSESDSQSRLIDRRSYLKLTGTATAAFASTVAAGIAGAQEDYEVIELGRNEAVTYDLSDGETFENVLIDQTAAGASYAIRARDVDDFTVRNVGFYGVGDRWNDAAANQHMLLSGNGTVENVYMSNFPTPDDESSSNTPMGGIYIRPSHAGHIDIRHTYIEGMGNNASYADRPGRGGGQGTVTYEHCYHANNTVSQFRIGTSGSVVRNSIGIVDDPSLERGTYIAGDSRTARGVWAWHNDDMTVENSTIYVNPADPEAGATFHARMHDESSGSQCVLNVENCYVNGDAPRLTQEGPGDATVNTSGIVEGPTASVLGEGGVPTAAEMAASGGREYVDPFDEGDTSGGDETGDSSDDSTDEDEGDSTSSLRIDGEGSSELSNYQFVVEGSIEKSDALSEYGNNATVSDQEVEGFVRGGVDGFRFDGELVEVEIDDGPTVYVDGEAIDPNQYGADDSTDEDEESLPHVIVFDGTDATEETRYEFTVDGAVAESTYQGASIDAADVIEGTSVEGVVDADSTDAYRFDGDIDDFRLFGPCTVDVEYDAHN